MESIYSYICRKLREGQNIFRRGIIEALIKEYNNDFEMLVHLREENARLREAARWIKTPEDPPNFDEWSLVAFQGAYYWVKNPPIIEHQEVG